MEVAASPSSASPLAELVGTEAAGAVISGNGAPEGTLVLDLKGKESLDLMLKFKNSKPPPFVLPSRNVQSKYATSLALSIHFQFQHKHKHLPMLKQFFQMGRKVHEEVQVLSHRIHFAFLKNKK